MAPAPNRISSSLSSLPREQRRRRTTQSRSLLLLFLRRAKNTFFASRVNLIWKEEGEEGMGNGTILLPDVVGWKHKRLNHFRRALQEKRRKASRPPSTKQPFQELFCGTGENVRPYFPSCTFVFQQIYYGAVAGCKVF